MSEYDDAERFEAELALRAEAIVGESPVWSVREKVLYWVDIPSGEVHRFDPRTGNDKSSELPQPVSALALREGRGLVVALRDGFAFVDPETKKLEMINEPEADLPDHRFNDAKCDPQGRFWGGNDVRHTLE